MKYTLQHLGEYRSGRSMIVHLGDTLFLNPSLFSFKNIFCCTASPTYYPVAHHAYAFTIPRPFNPSHPPTLPSLISDTYWHPLSLLNLTMKAEQRDTSDISEQKQGGYSDDRRLHPTASNYRKACKNPKERRDSPQLRSLEFIKGIQRQITNRGLRRKIGQDPGLAQSDLDLLLQSSLRP